MIRTSTYLSFLYLFLCDYILFFYISIVGVVGIILCLVAKVAATAYSVLTRPIHSLSAMPGNWHRIVFCVDSYTVPELMPGLENPEEYLDDLATPEVKPIQVSGLVGMFREEISNERDEGADPVEWAFPYVVKIGILLLLIIVGIVALSFRWSLKATAWVYFPLIMAVRKNLMSTLPAKDMIEDIQVEPLERLSRWYSAFVLVFLDVIPLALIVSLYAKMGQVSRWMHANVLPHFNERIAGLFKRLYLWATPDRIEVSSWHVTRFLTSFLTIYLFLYALKASRRLASGQLSEDQARATINGTRFCRAFLSLWTTGCSVWIVARSLRWSDLPPFVVRWLP